MNITYQVFDPGRDLKQQREVFRAAFPENVGTPTESQDHYHWKFHTFPGEPHSYEFSAHQDSELIGYYAAIPYPYEIGGQRVTCGMVCDVMTHPKMQGKGVFTGIGRYSTDALQKKGIAFTSGYPIRPEVIPGHLKVGWKIVYHLPMYIKLLRADAVLRSKKIGFAAPLVNLGLSLLHPIFAILNRKDHHYSAEILSRDEFLKCEGYEDFFDTWKSGQKNVLIKTREFLAWRTGAPQTDYKFVVVRKNRAITGLALTRFVPLKNIPSLAILDMMVLNEEKNGLGTMHHALKNAAMASGAEAMVTMMGKNWAKYYELPGMGFLKSPFEFSLIIKKLDPDMDDASLFNESNWHLMWVDSDDL